MTISSSDPVRSTVAKAPISEPALVEPGTLPPLRIRDLPECLPLRRLIGPSIILAGLALGSGEYVLWPYITFKSQFVFFWACLIAVVTQYFLNLEIMRWTLATGESTITGFLRVSRWLAPAFLLLNIVPWMVPAWSQGAAQLVGWLTVGPTLANGQIVPGAYDSWLAIAGIVICGIILTAGPVVYETVERVQLGLVAFIIVAVIGLAGWLIINRPDAVVTQVRSTVSLGAPQFVPGMDQDLTPMVLLGALAFAGAGGTMNLCQSNYIKDKGYGMGAHIGRITSPFTGHEEAISEVGYHFPHDAGNLARWKQWWRATAWEHFTSFLLTCIVCLTLLTLISYIAFYDANGRLNVEDAGRYKEGLGFILGESLRIGELIGPFAKYLFLLIGVAILFTTEFGVLDAASRISADIVKVAWLRENRFWSEGRLYFFFLWGEVVLACGILLLDSVFGVKIGALGLFKLTAAMNGGVMFLYSFLLFYMNRWRLPPEVRIPAWRLAILGWTILFFGFFSVWAAYDGLQKLMAAG